MVHPDAQGPFQAEWPKCADCGAEASPEFHGGLQVPNGGPGFFLYFCSAHRKTVDDAIECERLADLAVREFQLWLLRGGGVEPLPMKEKPKRRKKR